MSPRRRFALPALGLAAGLLASALSGCTDSRAADREPGAPVTEAEAESLSRLLQRNYQRGGADFVVTAPFGSQAVLTLTGEVDFRRGQGSAQAVTSYDDHREDATAAVFFTPDEVWVGVPGLAEALVRAGGPGADYLHRRIAVPAGGEAPLVDVLVRVVLNLGGPRADDPGAFRQRDWTWAGRRSIDSRLSALFTDPAGRSVAVGAADELLLQYVTPLPGQDFDVTVTLAGHGSRSIDLPPDEASAEADEHPQVAARLGL
jgi:hypothetical protein